MQVGERAELPAHKLFEHMDADEEPEASHEEAPPASAISGRDADGNPVHRGWPPLGPRRRWLEPFVLVLLAEGGTHGYSIIGQLGEMGVTEGSVDVGQVYKTLRDLEAEGQVASQWALEGSGPARRQYELTDAGWRALEEWEAVMQERRRLIDDFEARYQRARQGRAGSRKEGTK